MDATSAPSGGGLTSGVESVMLTNYADFNHWQCHAIGL
jgi:hypothetical protein